MPTCWVGTPPIQLQNSIRLIALLVMLGERVGECVGGGGMERKQRTTTESKVPDTGLA